VNLLLLAVEREYVVAALCTPEVLVEAQLERRRLRLELSSFLFVVEELAQQAGRAKASVVGEALMLCRGDRRLGLPAVRKAHRVVRVAPAVVVERLVGARALAVFDVAVAVEVGRSFEPSQRGSEVRLH